MSLSLIHIFKNGAMNLKVGILAAIGSFAGSALGAHIVLLLSDELLRTCLLYTSLAAAAARVHPHPARIAGAGRQKPVLYQRRCHGLLPVSYTHLVLTAKGKFFAKFPQILRRVCITFARLQAQK